MDRPSDPVGGEPDGIPLSVLVPSIRLLRDGRKDEKRKPNEEKGILGKLFGGRKKK